MFFCVFCVGFGGVKDSPNAKENRVSVVCMQASMRVGLRERGKCLMRVAWGAGTRKRVVSAGLRERGRSECLFVRGSKMVTWEAKSVSAERRRWRILSGEGDDDVVSTSSNEMRRATEAKYSVT